MLFEILRINESLSGKYKSLDMLEKKVHCSDEFSKDAFFWGGGV